MSTVTLKNVFKSYGNVQVIHGVDLTIHSGEFVVFVGPSGCGKSTLLRAIAGLEEISAGELEIGGQVMNDVAPARRGVAMVFQSYALYPHMKVSENISFAMRLAKTAKDVIEQKVRHAAGILRIGEYLDRLPSALSGGQRQRVAIARAFVREPDVFLFDEPLSNLDAELRVQTRVEIAKLHQDLDATMIFVTHDQVEAMTLADRIVVLRDGLVEQVGTPLDLYHHPNNKFVAQFIGSPHMNFFDASSTPEPKGSVVTVSKAWGGGSVTLELEGEGETTLGVRPEHLQLVQNGPIAGEVVLVEQLGEYALIHLETSAGTFTAKLADANTISLGDKLRFGFDPARAHLFDADGHAAQPAQSAAA